MKKYDRVAEISCPLNDKNSFLDGIAKRIDEYQQEGFEVEVQYQYGVAGKSVLILGYKEEK